MAVRPIARASVALVIGLSCASAAAGPVEVYREGPRYCPRERPQDAPVLDEAAIVARARKLVPGDFCGPTRFVSGCDTLVEYEHGSWRIYLHQYRRDPGRNDWLGLTHTYVILDRVGNCLANIPGTPLGSYN
jgi:hypothetical protein